MSITTFTPNSLLTLFSVSQYIPKVSIQSLFMTFYTLSLQPLVYARLIMTQYCQLLYFSISSPTALNHPYIIQGKYISLPQ